METVELIRHVEEKTITLVQQIFLAWIHKESCMSELHKKESKSALLMGG
jgi:hypothetical protein